MTVWKANADEKRAIRAAAAMGEGMKPGAIHIEVGERVSLDGDFRTGFNILALGTGENPNDPFDGTDLHQPLPWSYLDDGIELTADGKALVDFYVYEKLVGDHGDLLTNVQAHVVTVDNKPRLRKITGTGIPPISGEALWAFMHQPKHRAFGTRAYNLIEDWSKARAAMWSR